MSFLKKLFGKDYGKGHRLGDPSAPNRYQQQQQQQEYVRPQYVSEASVAAGQAALARLQQQKTPKQSNTILKDKAEETRKSEALIRQQKEADQLKEHYFSDDHIKQIEKSTHFNQNKIRVLFKSPVIPETLTEPMDLEIVQKKIIDRLMENLIDEPVLTSLTLLITSANFAKKSETKLNKCLDIIKKLTNNIIQNPNEEKFRKIRAENNTIKEDLLSFEYTGLLLNNIGFQLVKQHDENVYLFDYTNEDNFNKLKHLNESFEYVEPIVPEMDRCLKIIKLDNVTNMANENKFDLSEDFYSHSLDDIKKEQKQREEALAQMNMLRTKAMRERDAKLEIRKYNYCLIRVKFSDNFYLQAIFKANDTLQQLNLCVQDCLIDASIQFQLKTHLLKENADDKLTLAEIGLTPASLLHFYSPANISYNASLLKPELLEQAKNQF